MFNQLYTQTLERILHYFLRIENITDFIEWFQWVPGWTKAIVIFLPFGILGVLFGLYCLIRGIHLN